MNIKKLCTLLQVVILTSVLIGLFAACGSFTPATNSTSATNNPVTQAPAPPVSYLAKWNDHSMVFFLTLQQGQSSGSWYLVYWRQGEPIYSRTNMPYASYAYESGSILVTWNGNAITLDFSPGSNILDFSTIINGTFTNGNLWLAMPTGNGLIARWGFAPASIQTYNTEVANVVAACSTYYGKTCTQVA